MSLKPGRRLTNVSGVPIGPAPAAGSAVPPRGRALHASLLDSAERGRALLEDARRRAVEIIERAEREAADVRLRAEAEGRADATAALAARMLAQSAREARAEERALERSIGLAQLLAERLLGEALRLEPDRVVALARQALKEARGARQARLVAHPEDAALLERSLHDLGLTQGSVRIAADPTRQRGDLRLETELGVLDAELAPQLARLAAKLREAMHP